MLARISVVIAILAFAGPQAPAGRTPPSPLSLAPPPQPSAGARSPRNANYRIAATLDPSRRTINAMQVLTWRNIAAVPAPTLQFHLYYNAWRDERSSWMRDAALGGLDAGALTPEHRSAIDVTSLHVTRGSTRTDLTSSLRFIAPDDGNVNDRTVVEVPLAAAVAPGESVEVEIFWTSQVPRTIARTGYVGDFFFIAQWFPKIGVFQDSGWNCHQFHATTEFFADFGNYDVELTVPRGWIVGATGRLQETREGPYGTTHRYYQEDVHDFAWTTSPQYIERRARFEHPALPPVEMRLLLQPEHLSQAPRHFDATRAALKYYGEWFGAYPYDHITIVDPAYQSGADGMEYPTLFTAGTQWIAPRHAADPEDVTIHEAGHQFWYGVVATNEFEHAWMDEGLTTFATARTMEAAFSPTFYTQRFFGGFVPWVFRGLEITRPAYGRMTLGRASGDQQSRPSWRYWPPAAGSITYFKTAFWLQTLERMLGWDTLRRAMATYYRRYAFKHPRPEDFFAVVNEVSGRDLTWFFDQVYRSSHSFDYSIELVRSEPATPRSNMRTIVVARRLGEGVFPVDVRLVFDNGEEQRWHWDGRERWKMFETERVAGAAFAQVDPDRVLLLDVNTTNNSYTTQPRGREAARKWSLAWLIWLQDHLLTYGFFV